MKCATEKSHSSFCVIFNVHILTDIQCATASSSSSRSSESREGGLLRGHPHLRDGLRALHPGRGHRRPLPHEDDHAEDAAHAARAEALKVPAQETGNRK